MEYWCKDSLKSIQTFKKNWDYKSVTDEWTEGQTDGRTYRLLYIARFSSKEYKISKTAWVK